MDENTSIEIRQIPNKKGIRAFSINLEYFNKAHIIVPAVDAQVMRYETGLSVKDHEWLKEKGCTYDLNDMYTPGIPHVFWESSMVKAHLTSNPVFLTPGKLILDLIKYKFLLKSIYVYASEEEMVSGDKPQATHYIYDVKESIEAKASKLVKFNTLVGKVAGLSLTKRKEIVLLITDEITEAKSDEYLIIRMDEIMRDKRTSLILEDLLKDTNIDLSLKAEIRLSIKKGVLIKKKTGIHFLDINLGFDEKEVMKFITEPDNQEVYLKIKSKIK